MVAASSRQYNIGEKFAAMLYTYIIAMQVHQNRGKRQQRGTKIKLSYVMFGLVSGSCIGESGSIVGCTSRIGPNPKYREEGVETLREECSLQVLVNQSRS